MLSIYYKDFLIVTTVFADVQLCFTTFTVSLPAFASMRVFARFVWAIDVSIKGASLTATTSPFSGSF